jgi:hypothetical protein
MRVLLHERTEDSRVGDEVASDEGGTKVLSDILGEINDAPRNAKRRIISPGVSGGDLCGPRYVQY